MDHLHANPNLPPEFADSIHVHPDAPRLSLPGRDHGLGHTQGAVLARVEHEGCRILPGSAGGSPDTLRPAGAAREAAE